MNETQTASGTNFPTGRRKRMSLDQACKAVEASSSPVVSRILPSGTDQVEVAAFNSSI
jgi:hypothetical protein